MYYPELSKGEMIKQIEASQSPEIKYPENIRDGSMLRQLFFEETVKYQIEEFLRSDPLNGVSLDLISFADAGSYAIRKLLYRAPTLKTEESYIRIESFFQSLEEYSEFFTTVTETNGLCVARATNRFHTKEDDNSLKHNETLRITALSKYLDLKNF